MCLFMMVFSLRSAIAQDTSQYALRLKASLVDFPQNQKLPYKTPSMSQAIELSNNFYDLGFWSISSIGNRILKPTSQDTRLRKVGVNGIKYVAGLAFSKYGSELPIPLGVWAHEEFHRAVLGVNGLSSKNGNWIASRWDGTVYGISDSQLISFKRQNINSLLYSYISGVQSENYSTRINVIQDFYYKRSQYKNALYLYNAWYVWNYFRFSTSVLSDSVKIIAPSHENKNPVNRDFAGTDLTAWAYDMFQQSTPYSSRNPFPGGDGLNRRIGYADLPQEAKLYLKNQKKLSLINFINPAIFFINGITINKNVSFQIFTQYTPTQFGNDISVIVPLRSGKNNYLLGVHRYSNKVRTFWGIETELNAISLSQHIESNFQMVLWAQPRNNNFYDASQRIGGAARIDIKYKISKSLSTDVTLDGKTKGWQMGSPYLDHNTNFRIGVCYNLPNKNLY